MAIVHDDTGLVPMELDNVEGVGSSSTDDEAYLTDGIPIQLALPPLQDFVQSVTSTTCAWCHKKLFVQPGDLVKMTRNWITTDRGKSHFDPLYLHSLDDTEAVKAVHILNQLMCQHIYINFHFFRCYHMRVLL